MDTKTYNFLKPYHNFPRLQARYCSINTFKNVITLHYIIANLILRFLQVVKKLALGSYLSILSLLLRLAGLLHVLWSTGRRFKFVSSEE